MEKNRVVLHWISQKTPSFQNEMEGRREDVCRTASFNGTSLTDIDGS